MVFLSFHASADDICGDYLYCYDPDGGTATVTDLSNEFHYVFIGAHPDDELFIYPLLKNFCAENNAHCTMIIMSQGRGGCAAGVSPSSCQLTRALELKNSADYLESDLWHFDFPDGVTEITPYDWSGVVAAYDKKAQDYGASGTVGLLNFILRPLRPISSPLVVVSHDPIHGSTNHLDHKVLSSLVQQSVSQLRNEFPVTHYKMQSKPAFTVSNSPYVEGDELANTCFLGEDALTASNFALTNFQVFDYGYNQVYPSQLWHLGGNARDPGLYSFCYN